MGIICPLSCWISSSTPNEAAVLIGCEKNLYSIKINIYNGVVIWQQKISNSLITPSYVTMATYQSSYMQHIRTQGLIITLLLKENGRWKRMKKDEI